MSSMHEHELAGLVVDRRRGGSSGTRSGASVGQLREEAEPLVVYMRRTVEVNTAASSSAGSFTTTVSGHPGPGRGATR